MFRRTGTLAGLSLALFLTSCGFNERAAIETNKDAEAEVVQSESEVSEELRLKQIFLDKVKLNMSENEIRDLFGADFSLVRNVMGGNESWRYDLGKVEEYQFDDQGIDQVDVEGLRLGRIQQQLFIDWSADGALSSATLYMRSEEGDGYYIYELLPDGTSSEKYQRYE